MATFVPSPRQRPQQFDGVLVEVLGRPEHRVHPRLPAGPGREVVLDLEMDQRALERPLGDSMLGVVAVLVPRLGLRLELGEIVFSDEVADVLP